MIESQGKNQNSNQSIDQVQVQIQYKHYVSAIESYDSSTSTISTLGNPVRNPSLQSSLEL